MSNKGGGGVNEKQPTKTRKGGKALSFLFRFFLQSLVFFSFEVFVLLLILSLAGFARLHPTNLCGPLKKKSRKVATLR